MRNAVRDLTTKSGDDMNSVACDRRGGGRTPGNLFNFSIKIHITNKVEDDRASRATNGCGPLLLSITAFQGSRKSVKKDGGWKGYRRGNRVKAAIKTNVGG